MIEGLVSVITPMYNSERYIADAIKSVQNQTYRQWEMIIIDDSSSDRSLQIAEEYAIVDNRIKVYCNVTNQGVAYSRNRAISMAEGRYIAFLDSDDVWLLDKLEQQIAIMRERECALCYGNCEVVDEYGEKLHRDRTTPLSITYQQLLKGNPIPCVTVVIDRYLTGTIRMPQIGHEDYATWLSVLKDGYVAYGTGTVIAKYRTCKLSLSGNKTRAARWQWTIYRRYLKLGIIESMWYFANYIVKAIYKRI